MLLPEELRYSAEHEWVAVEGVRARVGITDFAQDQLGDVVYVELPTVGANVLAHGSVAEVNDALGDAPELVNGEPYGGGWIFVVEMADPTEVESLLDAAGYRALVEG